MVFNKSVTCKSELSRERERERERDFRFIKKRKKRTFSKRSWAINVLEQLGPQNSVGIKNGFRPH